MLNKAILLGRLTKDPSETRTGNGTVIARFTLAVDRRFNRDEADFLNIVAFNKTAEFVLKWFKKGQAAYVVGAIQTRSWTADSGEVGYVTEIIADEVGFGGGKKESEGSSETLTTDEEIKETLAGFVSVDDDPDLPF